MTTYVYDTSNASVTPTANIAADRARISTLETVLYTVGFPNQLHTMYTVIGKALVGRL
jgi:hypothetical protein